MEIGIRLVAQNYDIGTGKIIQEEIIKDEKVSKARTLKELGYIHIEQIDFLQKIQEFKISHQIMLEASQLRILDKLCSNFINFRFNFFPITIPQLTTDRSSNLKYIMSSFSTPQHLLLPFLSFINKCINSSFS